MRVHGRIFSLFVACVVFGGWLIHGEASGKKGGSEARQDEIAQTAGPGRLSDSAVAQIQALIADKDTRTPAQRKMDSQLIYETRIRSRRMVAAGVTTLETGVTVDAGGGVEVSISVNRINNAIPKEVVVQIEKLGGTIRGMFDFAATVEARLPLDSIETLAGLDAVRFIAPRSGALINRAERPAGAAPKRLTREQRLAMFRAKLTDALKKYSEPSQILPNIGSRNSQGDVTHRATDARGSFGVNGAGIRIGVLSDSFNNLGAANADILSGDLPGPGNPNGFTTPVTLAGSGDQPSGGTDEGRAMLQIVHDVAPGAQLFYATAFNSITDFANNIRALRGISSSPGPFGNVTPGCDIIIDDIFYFVETGLHDGQLSPSNRNMAVVTQAVNDVTADGALYFSSAGNSGSVTQGTAGAWEGDFTSGTLPAIIPGGGDALAWNGTDVGNTITATGGGPVTMQWSDPIGASSNDYDLFRLNSTLTTVIASSTNVQTGTQDPYEQVTAGSNTRLVVVRRTGAAARFISLSTNRGRLQYATNGQTRGHSAAATGFGVAATPAATTFGAPTPNGPFPGPFVSSNQVEPFSSDGPRRSFFNADGTAITPGNFLAGTNGGIVRQKPDITAADGVDTTLPPSSGLNPFYGTSAAAPHAGAIAALIKQAVPSATPAQLRNFLTSTALDIMAPGVDSVAGVGIVQAFQAVQATGATPQASLGLGTRTVAGDGRIDPNECNTLTIQLVNNGAVTASVISATLSTTTPNVTVTAATSAYPNLTSGGGTGANVTPFQVSTTAAALCGTTINFTLTVTYAGGPSPAVLNFTLPLGADVNNYQFASTPSGATIPAGGTFVSGTSVDDAVAVVTTPFAFSIYGTPVTAGQSISVSTNGNVQFVASGASDDFVNIGLPAGSAAVPPISLTAPAVFPYWDDLILTTPGGGVFTHTIGTPPNRQFIIEWRGRRIGDGATTQNLNFAVVFNEGSSQFEFRYVQTGIGGNANGSSATVGVQAAGAAGSNFTQFSFNQNVITAGRILNAALGQCTPGAGACGACPTITITPATLPAVTAGVPFSQQLTATGGTAPYTFAVTGGALPAGLTLSTAGLISGTPTATGAFNVTITATAAAGGCTGTITYGGSVVGTALPLMYVADTDNNRIQFHNGTAWALPPLTAGVVGGGRGQFRAPEAVTASAAGRIYVADTGNNRIHWFNGMGWSDFATPGTGLNQVLGPQGLTLDVTGGFLFVADTTNNRIMRFNAATPGAPGVVIAGPGTAPNQVLGPRGLAIDSAGTLYIADTGNNRITTIAGATTALPGTGTVLASLGSSLRPAQVRGPEGVAVDNSGNLYIADTGNARVILLPATGGVIVPGTTAAIVATPGSALGQVNRPEGVAVVNFAASMNVRPFAPFSGFTLVVSDTGNNRITGRPLGGGAWSIIDGTAGQTGTVGTGIGQFRGPSKIR